MRKNQEKDCYKEQQQCNPMFFEVRLLDGSIKIVQKDDLRGFIAANKQKVCSYAPYNL